MTDHIHEKRPQSQRRRSLIAGFGVLLVLCFGAGSTAADGSVSPDQAAREAAVGDAAISKVTFPYTDAQAAAELPHRDLTREEANRLLTEVFGSFLEGAAGIYDDVAIERFYSDNVALVSTADQTAGPPPHDDLALLESTLPLRTADESGQVAAVDLALEHESGELQPQNPLVEVGIPAELGEGISLPESNVRIELQGAPAERGPSSVDESVVTYPEVAEDTTFAVAPTPIGLETLTLLQSPDAPTEQTFLVEMPDAFTLQATEQGGAQIRDGTETVVNVLPPVAVDANGDPVLVRLDVSGDSMVLVTEPSPESAYPILVDPIFESYNWRQSGSTSAMADWRTFTNSNQFWFGAWTGNCPECPATGAYGLTITSGTGWVTGGAVGRWDYHVPRWEADFEDPGVKERPTTYIRNATFWNLYFEATPGNQTVTPHPFLGMYIWDYSKGFVSSGYRLGTEGNLTNMSYQYQLKNPNEMVGAKRLSLELGVAWDQYSQHRRLYVGSASVELSDKDQPGIGSLGSPSGWMNDKVAGPIPFSVSDPGLGVSSLAIEQPASSGGFRRLEAKHGCTGGVAKPCPRVWQSSNQQLPQPAYDPATMPQGENWLKFYAYDPLGQKAVGNVRVKTDHTAPKVALSGTLTEQATLGTKAAEYALKYSAADGQDAAPEALSPLGSAGTGAGQLERPMGVAVEASDNVLVTDRVNQRIVQYDKNGKFLKQIGTPGTGPGQINEPRGIDVAANGTIWVAEAGSNKRLQQFNAKGEYLKTITLPASLNNGLNAFVEPWGIAAGPGETLWVADPGADKIFRFREDGTFLGAVSNMPLTSPLKAPVGVAVDSLGNAWATDQENNMVYAFNPEGKYVYSFGAEGTEAGKLKGPTGIAITSSGNILVSDGFNNRIQQFETDGSYLGQFGSSGTSNAQFNEPRGVAVGAGDVALVADAGNRRIGRWGKVDHDPQSGVVKTEVKVDGVLVEPAHAPGCSTKNCAVSREWVLEAADYESGQHTVSVTATDAVGLSATKSVTVTTLKDTTPPQLTATNPLFTAPEGWVEQKSYFVTPTAQDSGYGVMYMALKIDGATVSSNTQGCPNGGCGSMLWHSVDMSKYAGGAHPAELIATDAAGNTTNKAWTINVAPKGAVPAEEAESTLEAMDATSPMNVVGPAQSEAAYPGTSSGLIIESSASESGDFTADGPAAPVAIDSDSGAEVTVEIPRPGVLESTCTEAPFDEKMEFTAEEEVALAANPQLSSCSPTGEPEANFVPVTMSPSTVSAQASEPVVSNEASSVIAPNMSASVDFITRPLYDGAMIFAAIRDSTAAETYSWNVDLEDDQELKLIDPQHAYIYYADGHLAFGITAVSAHDAVGASVPTELSVSEGNVLTLTVKHKTSPPGPFVYPVVAGTGWEGGFQTYAVVMPPPEPIPGEDEGEEKGGVTEGIVQIMTVGPPQVEDHTSASQELEPLTLKPEKRKFKFTYCKPHEIPGSGGVTEIPPFDWDFRAKHPGIVSDCSNPNLEGIHWMTSAHGWYHYKLHKWVWVTGFDSGWCDKYGSEQPAKVHCKLVRNEAGHGVANAVRGPIKIYGQYRFPPGKGHWEIYTRAICYTGGGELYPRPGLANAGPTERPLITEYETVAQPEKCNWK